MGKPKELFFFHEDFVNPWTALAALAVKNKTMEALSKILCKYHKTSNETGGYPFFINIQCNKIIQNADIIRNSGIIGGQAL